MDTLVNDALHGDFTPKGLLVDPANLIVPSAKFDALGNRRAALDSRGAISMLNAA